MTLITNLIQEDFILISADKRVTNVDEINKRAISRDSVTKLFLGDNFCIGIQGSVRTKKGDYISRLMNYIKYNSESTPPEMIDELFLKFGDVPKDNEVKELNLTISGKDDNGLFSVYLDLKNKTSTNCIKEDEVGLRFNNSNSSREMNFRQGKLYMENYLRNVKKVRRRPTDDFSSFSKDELIEILANTYSKFGENDWKFPLIGGKMDYCLINKKGEMTTVIHENE